MGLVDFVKSAGEKIFGKEEKAAEPQQNNAARAGALMNLVRRLDLKVEDLRIEVSGDEAVVRGKTPSQEMREKIVLAVGNTEGIAKVDDRLEVVKPEPEAQYYTVKKGDTLSKIAKEYYGNAMKYPAIFEANKPMLKDPDKIYPGQVLRIPPQQNA